MKYISDLRFVIGLFFLINGVLLLAWRFDVDSINSRCGAVFALFGMVMLVVAVRGIRVGGRDNVPED